MSNPMPLSETHASPPARLRRQAPMAEKAARLLASASVAVSAALAFGCAGPGALSQASSSSAGASLEHAHADHDAGAEKDGERKKVWSGRNYLKETVVEQAPRVSATAAGFDVERVWGGYDDWEPAVGADPSSSYVYQLTTRYGGPTACPDCSDPSLLFRASADGGATWGQDQFLFVSKGTQNDPMLEVAADGTIFALILHNYVPGIQLTRSVDRGSSWSRPVTVSTGGSHPKWSDRPVLAISRDGRDVYVAMNARASFIAASHDGGSSFQAAVRTSDYQRYWFHSAGAVAPDGTVYFGAVDFSSSYQGAANVYVIRSRDKGATWETLRIDSSAEMPDCPWADGCYFGFLGPSIGLSVDRNGVLLVAYNAGEAQGAPQSMWTRTSSDGGQTWSLRQRLSPEDPAVNAGFPAVAAGPSGGDFRVIWQDDRTHPTVAWNTWYARTTDGGKTWQEDVRVSDLGSGAPYKSAEGYAFPYGDYLEISVDSQGVSHLIWGEGSSYTGPGGTWYTRGQ